MRVELRFASVEAEAARKVESLLSPPDREVAELMQVCVQRHRDTRRRVRRALDYLAGLDSRSEAHPSLDRYLEHPVRVARMVAQTAPDADAEVLEAALLHNVFEVGGLAADDLEAAGYGERVSAGVRLLTIDRDRETDRGYLAAYYGRIESFGPWLALIKCIDRLDNVLGLQPFGGEFVRGGYLDLTLEFVVPMARRVEPSLGDYIEEAVTYARTVGFDPALARRYVALGVEVPE
jgi:(p)ppGpp synthase/HD superfamily hydrolase